MPRVAVVQEEHQRRSGWVRLEPWLPGVPGPPFDEQLRTLPGEVAVRCDAAAVCGFGLLIDPHPPTRPGPKQGHPPINQTKVANVIVKQMHKLGINSDVLQVLGFASIFASIATWRAAKKSGDAAHAERFGIFIGLWAPTFFALAGDVAVHEAKEGELPTG